MGDFLRTARFGISEEQANKLIIKFTGITETLRKQLARSIQENWASRIGKKNIFALIVEADHPCAQDYVEYLTRDGEFDLDLLTRISINGYKHVMDELFEKDAAGNPIGVIDSNKSSYPYCHRRLEGNANIRKTLKVYRPENAGGANYLRRSTKANSPKVNIPHLAEVAVLTAFVGIPEYVEGLIDAAEFATWNTRYTAFVEELTGLVSDIWAGKPRIYTRAPKIGTNLNMIWPPPPPTDLLPVIVQENSHECTREYFRRGIIGYDPKIATAEPAAQWAEAQRTQQNLLSRIDRFREAELTNDADMIMLEHAKILALGFTKVFQDNILFWDKQPVGMRSGGDRDERFSACHLRLAEEAAMIFMRRFELSKGAAQAAVVLAQNAAEAVNLRESAEKRKNGIDEARAAEAEAIRLLNAALGIRVGGRRRNRKTRSKRYRRRQRSVRA
jgi:hypothetical protein